MPKIITPSQLLGEIGETAARLKFLTIGFQFDARSRLETGIDGIAEVMRDGKPLAQMIAVQVKAKDQGNYSREDDKGFTYLLRTADLDYWRGSNLPVILVLYRQADQTFYWQEIKKVMGHEERQLQFDKQRDALNADAVDRLAALSVAKAGFGYYVPPLGGGEEALVNILPVVLPPEIYVASTPHTVKRAIALLFEDDESVRFDWIINGGTFWSFSDPRTNCCRKIVDLDQVEAIDTADLAFHEEEDERNKFSYLLRKALDHQVSGDLGWSKDRKIHYFRATAENQSRVFEYESTKHKTEAYVVNAVRSKSDPDRVDFVRHHAFSARFENLYDQWYLVINPTYYFTTNGFIAHSHPHGLLAGKKRLDKSASLRGQIIMWHRFLTKADQVQSDMFAATTTEPRLKFGKPPTVSLPTRVPEDVWGAVKKSDEDDEDDIQEQLMLA